jgi:predicted GNAT family N-acyltransferase
MPTDIIIHSANWIEDGNFIKSIRFEVFIGEQNVPIELEIDGLDDECFHALAKDTSGKAVGTARMQKDGHIGRIAVLKNFRKRGIGKNLVQFFIHKAASLGLVEVELNAQVHALDFYEKLGFEKKGDIFADANIPHVHMVRAINTPRK